jgi:hypothetical protein
MKVWSCRSGWQTCLNRATVECEICVQCYMKPEWSEMFCDSHRTELSNLVKEVFTRDTAGIVMSYM